MSLFGSNEKEQAIDEALAAELARIESMPLPALAEEVLVRGWGHGGPGDVYEKPNAAIAYIEIAKLYSTGLNSGPSIFGSDSEPMGGIRELLEEALQVLEHASLVIFRVSGGDIIKAEYRPTRAGLEAINAGDVQARLEV